MPVTDQPRSLLRGFFLGAAGVAVIVAMVLTVRSCVRRSSPPLPTEPQTLTGVLHSVPLSLERRGTHLLTEIGGNRELAFVESSSVNLRAYEGLTVEVAGILEANIDPDALPVLNASGVTLVAMPVRSWTVAAFGMSIDVPDGWDMLSFDDGVRFVQTGTTVSMLTVTQTMLTSLPSGIPMTIGGRPSVTVMEGDDATGIAWFVKNGRDVIAIAVPAAEQTVSERGWESEEYARLINSIRFASPSSTPRSATGSSMSAGSGSGMGLGAPCGGPAGILCPEGQYCAVTDMTDGIGRCRTLRR